MWCWWPELTKWRGSGGVRGCVVPRGVPKSKMQKKTKKKFSYIFIHDRLSAIKFNLGKVVSGK